MSKCSPDEIPPVNSPEYQAGLAFVWRSGCFTVVNAPCLCVVSFSSSTQGIEFGMSENARQKMLMGVGQLPPSQAARQCERFEALWAEEVQLRGLDEARRGSERRGCLGFRVQGGFRV